MVESVTKIVAGSVVGGSVIAVVRVDVSGAVVVADIVVETEKFI